MGIKDFYKHLKVKHPECFVPVHYSQFRYQKIAIDMMNLLYVYKARNDKDWMKLTINFLIKLRMDFIHPVCVFDGQSHVLKQTTVQKRRQDREKGRNRLDSLKHDVQLYNDTGEITDTFRTFLHTNAHKDLVSKLTNQPIVSRITDHINKQYKNYDIHFRTTEIDILKLIIKAMGICVLTARHDGEALCSYLSATNQVDVVISNDSDVFFFGCKRVIFKFTEDGGYLIDIHIVLSKLGLTHEQFVDLCLLCGTDFNDTIRGIGFCKAYNLIKQHSSIKNINLPLNHTLLDEVRQMTIPNLDDIDVVQMGKPVDTSNLELLLFQQQISIPIHQFIWIKNEVELMETQDEIIIIKQMETLTNNEYK